MFSVVLLLEASLLGIQDPEPNRLLLGRPVAAWAYELTSTDTTKQLVAAAACTVAAPGTEVLAEALATAIGRAIGNPSWPCRRGNEVAVRPAITRVA